MKKWIYLIFPGVMLGLFLIVYTTHKEEAEARELAREKAIAEKKAEDERQKKEAEERAKVDAEKRQKEREEEQRKKEEERRAKQEAADKEVRDQTAKFRADADKSAKEAAELEIQLDRMRKEREQMSRQTFEIAKQVEAARVAKRNAELQQQHLTQMIVQRANQSTLVAAPTPPPSR